ncbi:hypothetical protein AS29_005915 [Bacillus sp. SJS]|nr:hypothetical protein AS29_005915 [Bacillus sp. SJS]
MAAPSHFISLIVFGYVYISIFSNILAASLMPVARNVGIAFVSALGVVVYHQGDLMIVTWSGGLMAIAASLLTFVSYPVGTKGKRHQQHREAADVLIE